DDAAADVLRSLAYIEDLCRHSTVSSRFQFAPMQTLSATRLEALVAEAPLGQSALDRTLKGLAVLDDTNPPPPQTIQIERLPQLISLGQVATTNSGPGRVPFWTGIFDFSSTHQMADAAVTTQTLFDRIEKSIDDPVLKSTASVEGAADELRRSTN